MDAANAEGSEKKVLREKDVGNENAAMVFLLLVWETPALSGRCFPMGIRKRMYGSDVCAVTSEW